jgi:hypothetical protein
MISTQLLSVHILLATEFSLVKPPYSGCPAVENPLSCSKQAQERIHTHTFDDAATMALGDKIDSTVDLIVDSQTLVPSLYLQTQLCHDHNWGMGATNV